MELLTGFGIGAELSEGEFLSRLRSPAHTNDQIKNLRCALFRDCVKENITGKCDCLVTRRKVGTGKTIREKHVMDVWSLVCAIKNGAPVPRVLLKNGKRARADFQSSQERSGVQQQETHVQPVGGNVPQANQSPCGATAAYCGFDSTYESSRGVEQNREVSDGVSRGVLCPIDKALKSSVLCKVNELKHAVSSLQQEVYKLKSQYTSPLTTLPPQSVNKPTPQCTASPTPCGPCGTLSNTLCWVYVCVGRGRAQDVGFPNLETILSSKINCYVCLRVT